MLAQQPTDSRHADLFVSATTFLTVHDLHPDPATYLAHGYVDLCLAAWPTAAGAPLDLATRWALLIWLTDDVFDDEMRDATPRTVIEVGRSLVRALGDTHRLVADDHPAARALAELARETRLMMPEFWWRRYREQLEIWVDAASEKLLHHVQPKQVPTLREYLTIRPADGGMLLAAMWCELAEQCITPDWNEPLLQDMLKAFSTVGCLVNDLSADVDDTFTAVGALVGSQGLPRERALREVRELLDAEELRFRWHYDAVRASSSDRTFRFAGAVNQFRRALTGWTAVSSRYRGPRFVLAAPEAGR